MTASLHKLTAGSGYDYLTRQVAAMDSTGKGRTSLASYYSEKGEVPGRWVGTALPALEMPAGSAVTAEQMRALFGAGMHPNMAARLAALPTDASPDQVRDAARLGTPFKVHAAATRFQHEVAERTTQWATRHGLDGGEVPLRVLAEIRNDIAREQFTARIGRTPNAVELSSEVARLSRNPTTACAGYDITFTPVKSISTLWAVAPTWMAAQIEQAHDAAVADALRYLEQRVLFSRRGAAGVRQVEVTGLIGAAFTHRDSRAGDPNLHTHVAIANKVQTLDGAWLAIDGRPLHAGMVSISEVYNTQLEAHLAQRLGLRFAAEPLRDPSKRPIREVVGVPARLREAWSSRRAAIEARQAELAAIFQDDHGRPPTPVEALKLAQQATLETRDAKHEPRTLAEQRAAWRAQAVAVLGASGIPELLRAVSGAPPVPDAPVEADWLATTAAQVVEQLSTTRASWNAWHLHAEASRRARERASSPKQASALTDQLMHAAAAACVPIEGAADPISDPAILRRSSGESMYVTVGSQRYTSREVVAAEELIISAAARTDGRRIDEADLTLALLAANSKNVTLNAGQTSLVRELSTSGHRVQLALAAAGSGKTTALSVLAEAWREGGGTVLGLAPSAVAARVLDEHIGHSTTLAKMAWDIDHRPEVAQQMVGPETLVIVDEAGMADTPTLARILEHAMRRGASVRLIGDDQQLAAIGAGGILRDIANHHGVVQLSQIMRFDDPAEAAASIALRDGRPEALGYYLDHHRLHAGSDETILRSVLDAWGQDRASGLDSIMLAATRDHVTTLNKWAREDRIASAAPTGSSPTIELADGNLASTGDLILTRMNDRRLRISATDWVKNGDRWIINSITPTGSIQATHTTSGLRAQIPADYVHDHVHLGYALTIHGAQGTTVDTTHTIITGSETRQQLYVALTRGRQSNHSYVQVLDPVTENSPIHPNTLHPTTAVDTLQAILARDGSATSATTQQQQAHDPATRLGQAVARYTDAITVAIENLHNNAAQELDRDADDIVDHLTAYPAWPTLRAHLLQLTADAPQSALDLLRAAVDSRELVSAADPAAVLSWRLPHPTGGGPLPWLPPIPASIAGHPQWNSYLTARSRQVRDLAADVAASADPRPVWALPGQTLNTSAVQDIAVWRAACQVDPTDRRPTGPTQLGSSAQAWQQRLNDRIRPAHPLSIWHDLLTDIRPDLAKDPYITALTHRLAALHANGVPVTEQLAVAVAEAPLPAQHAAAALWWRLSRHIADHETGGVWDWEPRLVEHIGYDRAAELEASPWWPHLAAALTQAHKLGIDLSQLARAGDDLSGFDDACHAMLWRAHHLSAEAPELAEPPHPDDLPPDDIANLDEPASLITALEEAARLRERTEPDFADLETRQAFATADRWESCPHTPQRLAEVTEAAARYYEERLPGSWTQTYMTERLGHDLTGDPRFRLGHAPAGWTNLTNHLRRQGFTPDELIAAGVATTSRHERLIDRFRDRAILPIIHDEVVVGFVARRHPDVDDTHGPKYINSPTNPLFAKRGVLYGGHLLDGAAIPVIAEGPLDAIAITLAGKDDFTGVAPLGTALTPEQALLLGKVPSVVIATDNDLAGNTAAEYAFWLLAQHRQDPGRLQLPPGSDPAEYLHDHGSNALGRRLDEAIPQAHLMIRERTATLPVADASRQISEITGARPSSAWKGLDPLTAGASRQLLTSAHRWTTQPAASADAAREQTNQMRRRWQQAAIERWKPWAAATAPELPDHQAWSDIAARLDDLHQNGENLHAFSHSVSHLPVDAVAEALTDNQAVRLTTLQLTSWVETIHPGITRGSTWKRIGSQLEQLRELGVPLESVAHILATPKSEDISRRLNRTLLEVERSVLVGQALGATHRTLARLRDLSSGQRRSYRRYDNP